MDEQKFTGDSSNLSFPAAQGREASADAPGERKSSPIFPGDIVDGSWDFEPLTFPDFAAEAEKGPRHAAPKRNILSVIGGDASDSSETGESAAQQGATGESASQESPTVFLPEGASSEGAHPLDHMSAAPVAVDQPSTRTETAGGEQTVTLPPVSGNAENPLDLDELADSDSDSRRSASGKRAGTAGKKRIIIIAVVLAVVLVAGIGGFMLWKGSQSGKRDDAVAACSRAAEQYNKARKALDAALKDAKSAQTITSAQVTDAATVQQLKQQVDNAGRFGEAQSCATSRSLTDLKNGAKFMQTKSDDMSRSAAAIRKAASAVNVSKTAKDFDSLKDAVATAQDLLDSSNGNVDDESVRDALQQAIDAANTLIDGNSADDKAITNALSVLESASGKVQDAMNAASSNTGDDSGASDTNGIYNSTNGYSNGYPYGYQNTNQYGGTQATPNSDSNADNQQQDNSDANASGSNGGSANQQPSNQPSSGGSTGTGDSGSTGNGGSNGTGAGASSSNQQQNNGQ